MRSFFTLTIFTALTAAAPIANGLYGEKSRRTRFSTLAGREVGIDGTCGPIWGGTNCAPGLCCSSQGYCGTSDAYCAAGCQSPFGTCASTGGSSPAPSIPAVSVPVPTTPASPAPVASSPSAPAPAPVSTSVSAPAPVVTSAAPSTAPSSTPASQALANPSATPSVQPSSNNNNNGGSTSSGSGIGLGDVYNMYTGSGSTSQGWPSQSQWMSFDNMWTANLPLISQSCEWSFNVPNNSDEETAELKSAIQSVSQSSGVDDRYILAIVMQESKGCVRAPTTNNGVVNPGLMQSSNGKGSCNTLTIGGTLQNPCPQSEIVQMIQDGVSGGDMSLQSALKTAAAASPTNYYIAARIYNSGSVSNAGDLSITSATRCYSSDVANRLTGWAKAATGCHLTN